MASVSINFHGIRIDPIATVAILVAGVKAAWHAYLHRLSQHWPTVYGTCTLAEVSGKNDNFHLRLLYSYNAPGERYADSGESQKDFSGEDEAQAWAEALREKTIPVRYNPTKPGKSVLWDSELEAIVEGSPVVSNPASISHQPVESWERSLFPALMILTACAFIVSLVVHVSATAGIALVGNPGFFGLHAASILLFFPAAKAANRQGRCQSLDVIVKSWPKWLRIPAYLFFYYTIFNFALCFVLLLLKEPGYSGIVNGGPSPHVIRWFSGHWMIFFLAEFGIMYTRLRSGSGDLSEPQSI
jgi:hypothetical protein